MIIQIDYSTTVNDIQRLFQKAYPFLKIEFADKPHLFSEPTIDPAWYAPGERILNIATKDRLGFITFYPWDKTGNLEREFHDKFGLYPQIFRRHEDEWLQSAGSDELSLEEQNELGKESLEQTLGFYWLRNEIVL
ncbi:MAG TPA: hypothetical protein VGD26_05190 [Chitinophagaceae bacterium]